VRNPTANRLFSRESFGRAEYNYDNDAAQSGDIDNSQETWLEATVEGPGTLRFEYKLSAQEGDEFTLIIDDEYRMGRNGSVDWTDPGPIAIYGSSTHTIRWRYKKDGSGSEGSDCLWVDHVRWTGAMPSMGEFNVITYVYDAEGRRIEKKYDGVTQVKFVYAGDQIIAEYDGSDNLLRKYVYGPGVDEPVCMIETAGSATYYYHYDALGSVVMLTDEEGNAAQFYDYSVYGQVSAWDENHPNRFMFTGREFDKDTGLYYYRARYYHPEIGRFLQTDPIGYADGMNLYKYCRNSPLTVTDASGLQGSPGGHLYDPCDWNDLDWGDPHPCPLGEALTGIGAVGLIDAATAALLGLEAIERANNAFPNDPDKANAYQHCWWSCRMAQKMDPNTAREVGEIHEDCVPGNDRDRDVKNNEWGIACGDRDCDTCCRDYMKKGYVK